MADLPYDHPGAPGGPPTPAPLYPNRLVEYTGDGVFDHVFFGVRCVFEPQEKYGGRKIFRVNRTDIFHKLTTIPSGNFVVAEDLEDAERIDDQVRAIAEHADVIMDALKKTSAFQAAVLEAIEAFGGVVEQGSSEVVDSEEEKKPRRTRKKKDEPTGE